MLHRTDSKANKDLERKWDIIHTMSLKHECVYCTCVHQEGPHNDKTVSNILAITQSSQKRGVLRLLFEKLSKVLACHEFATVIEGPHKTNKQTKRM